MLTPSRFLIFPLHKGVLALYYGAGCKRGADGWSVLVVSDATEGNKFENGSTVFHKN